ncbi:MFS transporter [Tistrella sp.]|nr:MFS transporter [Tistrella sp.]MAD36118.1 MFS transporter [Tistrella sp.]
MTTDLDTAAPHHARTGRPGRLAFALLTVTTAGNLFTPLSARLAQVDGEGTAMAGLAFAAYVGGALPVLLAGSSLPDRLGALNTARLALGLALAASLVMILWPGILMLGLSRALLGIAVAITSTLAPALMAVQCPPGTDPRRVAARGSVATTTGFGFGAALTALCLLLDPQSWMQPVSGPIWIGMALLALTGLHGLPDAPRLASGGTGLRWPAFPPGTLVFGGAICIAWAVVGLVIAVLPASLARAGLGAHAGFATFLVIVPGILAVPAARRMAPEIAIRRGLAVLVPGYALIAWGALSGSVAAVFAGTALAATACYGLIHAGGLAGILMRAGPLATRATAGFFLFAYAGFSLPVILTGAAADQWGQTTALTGFGAVLCLAALILWRHSTISTGHKDFPTRPAETPDQNADQQGQVRAQGPGTPGGQRAG